MNEKRSNGYSLLIVIFVALGSLTFGYSNVIIGTTLAQPTFISYFGLDTSDRSNAIAGTTSGIYTGGGLIGALLSSWAADHLGRKKAIFVGSLLATIGGALQAGSVAMAMFLVFRFVNGLGVGMLLTLVPLYQSEVSAPHSRGLMVGFHGICATLGYFGASWIGFGFYWAKGLNGAEWRLPLAIQAIPPLLCVAGIMFLPESPRWLISQDRFEEALDLVKKLHRHPSDPDNIFAFQEFRQIKQQLEIDRKYAVSWAELFRKPSYRKRMIIGFIVLFGAQTTGTTVIANYGPALYGSLGFDTTKQLLLGAVYATLALIGNVFNAFTIDRIGRVKALKIGWIGDLLALIGECVSVSQFEKSGGRSAAIASVFFLFMHIAFFAFNIDVTTYVYTTEIFPYHIRAKGMAFSIVSYFASLIIYLQVAPIAFANIGWKFYLVFIFLLFCFTVPLFFYFPESKGVSLEEISRLFGDEATTISLRGNSKEKDREETTEEAGGIVRKGGKSSLVASDAR